jgi:Ca2+-binding EF-hand superfamily protein
MKRHLERFFRVEPARYMSKPQFVTALRRAFGDQVLHNEAAISKLFESFDLYRRDEMDWRAFLTLLMMTMQPDMPLRTELRCART